MQNGKGDSRRPLTGTDDKTFQTNWDRIFKKDPEAKDRLQKVLDETLGNA